MCLGAKHIVMTKQATLGPIDPSVNNALNPQIPGAAPDARAPVSVEAVNGFLEMARMNMRFPLPWTVKDLLLQLSDKIHPLVLGEVFRSKSQIEMLGTRLLKSAGMSRRKIRPIISFLCSESGSHDYSIHRREARSLGLPVETPDAAFYAEIKALYDDFATELALTDRWNPVATLGNQPILHYVNKRCLLESRTGGSYYFSTEGNLNAVPAAPGQPNQVQDVRTFEGWKYEPA